MGSYLKWRSIWAPDFLSSRRYKRRRSRFPLEGSSRLQLFPDCCASRPEAQTSFWNPPCISCTSSLGPLCLPNLIREDDYIMECRRHTYNPQVFDTCWKCDFSMLYLWFCVFFVSAAVFLMSLLMLTGRIFQNASQCLCIVGLWSQCVLTEGSSYGGFQNCCSRKTKMPVCAARRSWQSCSVGPGCGCGLGSRWWVPTVLKQVLLQ